MNSLIDTHAHLDDKRFRDDLPDVLQRAVDNGVTRIITIGTTAESSRAAVALANQFDPLFAAVGIQPNCAADAQTGDWDVVLDLVSENKVVALGETGLDRHWDFTPFELQEDYFARHLELSRTTGLPVVIHCRKAEADTVKMLREDFDKHGPVKGVMHSFSGDLDTARACLEMGLYISFAGMVTYKNADDLRAVAAEIPMDRLLVETDSPYLVPVPMRGKQKRNEPGLVVHTARCLAEVKGVEFDQLAEMTTGNAERLFGLEKKK